MSDFTDEFAEALTEIREEFAVSIIYLVGSTEYEIENVSKGSWAFRFINNHGVSEHVETTDFLIGTDDLEVIPVAGHRIRETVGAKVCEYEVGSPNKEPCWRWSDNAGHSQRRVHTKLVKTTDA